MTQPTISPLAKKLGIKPEHRITVLGAPDGVLGLLEPLPPGAIVSTTDGRTPSDCVLVFARDAAALSAALPSVLAATGLVWVAYPKGGTKAGTDLNRDILWREMQTHGLSGVTLVAVNDVWSALRLRPSDQVGT